MGDVILKDDDSKRASSGIKGDGQGIQEILFFPSVNQDLDPDSPDRVQQFWALDANKLKTFEEEIIKYREAAEKLAKAKEEFQAAQGKPGALEAATKKLLEAQNESRALFEEEATEGEATEGETTEGETTTQSTNEKKDSNPIKGVYKNLIECTGSISKKTHYISVKDLVKVKDTKAPWSKRRLDNFRFDTNMFGDTAEAKDMYHTFYEIATDSNDGTSDEKIAKQKEANEAEKAESDEKKETKEKNSNVEKALAKLKVDMKETWKFGEGKTQGSIKAKHLARFLSPTISGLFTDENYEVIDNFAKYVNTNAKMSIDDKTYKRDHIIELLEKEDDQFGHHDWNKVMLGIKNLWGDTHETFVSDIEGLYKKAPLNISDREALITKLKEQALPSPWIDFSAGAQLMRYSANCGGTADFNYADGNVKLAYAADAKLSLAEASSKLDIYLPDQAGQNLVFNMVETIECYEFEERGSAAAIDNNQPLFLDDNTMLLPASIVTVVGQVKNLKFDQLSQLDPNKEFLIQVVGHTDATGSVEYNQKLGQSRANAVQAFFTNNHAAWTKNFKDGMWGDEEREMMLLAYHMTQYGEASFEEVMSIPITDTDGIKENLAKKITLATKKYHYKEELTDINNGDNPEFGGDNRLINMVGIAVNPHESANKPKTDAEIVKTYIALTTAYALNKVGGVNKSHFRYFYVDQDIYPAISKGETDLVKAVPGKAAENRRVTLSIKESVRTEEYEDIEIDLGKGRFHIEGEASAFIGASIDLSTSFEINTCKGVAQLVGKKEKSEEKLTEYQGDTVVAKEKTKDNPSTDISLFGGDAGGNVSAFAGGKAQAALAIALEWENPDKAKADALAKKAAAAKAAANPTTETTKEAAKAASKDSFGVLASVGGSVCGTAGIGIEAEFKIGYDDQTGTFQVKLKATATWGFGGGGALSFSVGVHQLFDFVVLVHKKLEENNFNIFDIFEKKHFKDNSTETESGQNVYDLYTAWLNELWQQEDYFKLAGALMLHSAVTAFAIFQKGAELVDKFNEYEQDRNQTIHLANNIMGDSEMLSYVVPQVKGRMLYQLAEFKYMGWVVPDLVEQAVDATLNFIGVHDAYKLFEDAAVRVLLSISTAREWQETMECMAMKTADGEDYQIYDSSKTGPLLSFQESKQFLQDELLTERDDWERVENHIKSLEVKKLWPKPKTV